MLGLELFNVPRLGILKFTACQKYLGVAIYLPVKETLESKLPPASAVTLLLEQVRILMKTHAFIRSNIPKSLSFSKKKLHEDESDDDSQALCPDFSKFLYFMFAPTLVYRNHYPR